MEIKMKKADIIFICLLITIILSSMIPIISSRKLSENSEVLIYINGKLEHQLPLNSNTEIQLTDIGTVVIHDNLVYIKNSSCKDKLCEHFGKISHSYQSIICLPNKTVIKISSAENDFDDISG